MSGDRIIRTGMKDTGGKLAPEKWKRDLSLIGDRSDPRRIHSGAGQSDRR